MAVGRGGRKIGDGVIMRQLALIGSIPIHDPDLFGAGSFGNEDDSSSHQALAAKRRENIGGVTMPGVNCAGLIERSLVDLAENLRLLQRGDVRSRAIKPSENDKHSMTLAAVTEAEIIGRNGRQAPIRQAVALDCNRATAWRRDT